MANRVPKSLLARRVARDLAALQPNPSHEPLLAENEGVDVFVERLNRHRFGHSRVEDHEARTCSYLPPAAFIDVIEGSVVHEEQDVAVRLHPRLESIRNGRSMVIAHRSAVADKRAVTSLGTKDKTRFDDGRENKGCGSLIGNLRRLRVLGIEPMQSLTRISIQFVSRSGASRRCDDGIGDQGC